MSMASKLDRQSLAPRLLTLSLTESTAQQPLAQTVIRARQISSRALLGDASSLCIDHEGVTYVLRATRLGKLILTK
jgi:hemin uptake protein HemP